MPRTAITFDEIRTEAERRGYSLTVDGERDDTTLHVAKKQFPHVKRSFSEHPDFSLDPRRADEYALLQAYYWVRGYTLSSGDDGKVLLQRAMHHPAFQQNVRHEQIFDYFWDANGDLAQLHQVMLQWVNQAES
jgi:ribosomal protein S12 methylthiotransferase accessory factor YcaO